MHIIVGSTSPRKIAAVKSVIKEFANTESVDASGCAAVSNVPETPYDRETYDGARNRAKHAREFKPDADFAVGLESGLVERYGHIYEEAWAVMIDWQGNEVAGYSSGLKVPDFILREMAKRKIPHSDFMTILEKELGNMTNDTWGTYSGGSIVRTQSLIEAIRNAAVQLLGPKESLFHRKE